MKAPSPAFSIYPKDIESDETCKEMTHAEFGMYMRLLLNCWTEGSIPSEPIRLQRLLKVSARTLAAAWPNIAPCFTDGQEGRLVQSRLEIEREKQVSRAKENSLNGEKGGRPPKDNGINKTGKRTVIEEKPFGFLEETETKGRARASSSSSVPSTSISYGDEGQMKQPPEPVWLVAATGAWKHYFQGENLSIWQHLHPLVKEYGDDVILGAWDRYCAAEATREDGMYASPGAFARKPGPWMKTPPKGPVRHTAAELKARELKEAGL